MGDPKRTKKHYETPKKPFDKKRLDEEREVVRNYGLKNKRELWRVETILRKKRENARKLLARPLEERLKREKELLASLAKLGLLTEKATLDDVLTLSSDSLLERRLQSIVMRKGLANTISQSRQFIVHGHIAIDGKKVSSPSYLVTVDEESKIGYYGKPMELAPKEEEPKKDVKKEFEEAKPIEEAKGKAEEKAKAVEKPEAKETQTAPAKEKKEAAKKLKEVAKKEKKPKKEETKEETQEKKAEDKKEVKENGNK